MIAFSLLSRLVVTGGLLGLLLMPAVTVVQAQGFSGRPSANQVFVGPASGPAAPASFRSPTSWFDSAYCNTVGFLIVRFTGAWTCSKAIAANPVWWGADPTGVSDSTSAFNAALAANSSVQFPIGKFTLNSAISYTLSGTPASVAIGGQGQDLTILNWPNASGGITFNYSSPQHTVHVHDLTFTTSQAGGGNAIALTQSSGLGNFAATDFYKVTFRGDDNGAAHYWNTAINDNGVSGVNVEGVTMYGTGSNGVGFVCTGPGTGGVGGTGYAIYINISKSIFNGLNIGVQYASFCQGITITQSNFQNGVVGVNAPASQTGALSQLMISDSQFANSANQISILTSIGNVQLHGNDLFCPTNNSCILISAGTLGNIYGNGVNCATATGTNGIVVNGNLFSITGNTINGCNVGTLLQASSANNNVQGNIFNSNTTAISNSGTTNVIANNSGYNPVGPSGITVTASPFTYTAGSSPETVYIFGGTVSSVTFDKNGGALGNVACSASPCTVDLGPFEQTKVTYTGAPNMNKMVH